MRGIAASSRKRIELENKVKIVTQLILPVLNPHHVEVHE